MRGTSTSVSSTVGLELISSRIEIIEEKRIVDEASKKKEEQWEETIKMCGAKYGVRGKKKLGAIITT